MERKIKNKVTGFRTIDGAGVSLVRVLGNQTVEEYDPILMLDSFDSTNPEDYIAGFPMHPHRGIETITYLYKGRMRHKDTLGNEDEIGDGEIQWMNAGSGILHEEQLPPADRMLGVQLWLNLPAKEKMSHPTYHSIKYDEIEEIDFDHGMIRLLAGEYKGHHGFTGDHLPLNYYDIHLNKGGEITLDMQEDDSVMIFTLLGEVYIDGELIEEKTAVKLTEGDKLTLVNKGEDAQILYMASKPLKEDIAWAGPIVMNTQRELMEANIDLRNGTFIKEELDFHN